jgi:dienelactone hydrolase
VTVTPTDAEEPGASTTVSRRLPDPETAPLGEGLAGTLHLPDGDGPAPGVLLLHGSGGRELTQRARLLAGHGVVTASIEYFGESHTLRDHLVEVPIEYVRNAIETLAGHDRVAGDRVGLYGVSKGGELALLAGAHSDRVGAVASIVGSGLVWAGGSRLSVADTSSWSLDGEPVPYVPIPADEYDRRGSRPTFAEGFAAATEEEIEDATIPVDRIDGPVLLVSAGDDGLWNSVRYSEIAAERLAAHDHPHDVQHLVYEEAGHFIRPPYLPTYGLSRSSVTRIGGTQAGNARAAAEHWPQVVALFEDALGS